MYSFLGALWLVLMLTGSTVMGQTAGEAASSNVVAEKTEPQAISSANVPRSAENVLLELLELETDLKPREVIIEIEAEIENLKTTLDDHSNDPRLENLTEISSRTLNNLYFMWQRDKSELNGWLAKLETQLSILEQKKSRLSFLSATWRLTQKMGRTEKYPEPLLENIQTVLKEVRSLEANINDRLNTVLSLHARISEKRIRINEQLSKFQLEIMERRRQLLRFDSVPIWNLLSQSDGRTIFEQVKATWLEDYGSLTQFIREYEKSIILHFSIFILFAIILLNLKRKSKQWMVEGADKTLSAAAKVLTRPFSGALLISLILTGQIYPNAPLVVTDMSFLAFVIPLVRLLPVMIKPEMHVPAYAFIGLFALDQFDDIMEDHSLVVRLMLLGISTLTLITLIWYFRPNGIASRFRDNRWLNILKVVVRFSVLLLGVAIISNILGNVSLAQLLSRGTLNSIYIGIVLYMASLILQGVIVILLRSRLTHPLRIVRKNVELIKDRATNFIDIVLLLVWLYAILSLLDIYEPGLEFVLEILGYEFGFGSLVFSLGDILIFTFTLWFSLQLSRFIRFILQEDILSRVTLPRGVAGSISLVAHYLIMGIGFIIALSAAGIEWSRFALLAGALGVGIGFGLQNLVNNFVSGLILIFERPIKVGDTVEVGQLLGNVKRIGIRASTIRTYDGAEVIVPNGNLISAELVNWTLSDRLRRLELAIGVAYGTDPNQVIKILEDSVEGKADILESPEPIVLFTGFGESSLNFVLRFWTANFEDWRTLQSNMYLALHNALYDAGIEIPFPQRDLHLRTVDGEAGKTLTGNPEIALPEPAAAKRKTEKNSNKKVGGEPDKESISTDSTANGEKTKEGSHKNISESGKKSEALAGDVKAAEKK